jgi:transmembrane sensor
LAVEPAPVFSSDQVLAQVASLRSRGSFEEAVVVLTRALEESPAGVTQERLGFELGSILSHQLHDGPRACAFWTSYQQQHVGGRYAREVSAARQELGCE